MVKNPPAMQEMWVQSLGGKDLLEKEMATHDSIFACLPMQELQEMQVTGFDPLVGKVPWRRK